MYRKKNSLFILVKEEKPITAGFQSDLPSSQPPSFIKNQGKKEGD